MPTSPPPSTAGRIARVIRQDVQSTHGYAIQPSAGLVKLDAMENPFRLPEPLQRELGERLGARGDQPLSGALRGRGGAALSRHVELPAGCKLMLGNGSDELIDLLSVACDVPGAAILAPEPGFVMYGMSAQLQGLRFVGVPLTAEFELDEAAMLAAIERERPALTYIAYPNNPTAQPVRRRASIDRIVAAVGAQDGLVVFDEAYQPFSSRTLDAAHGRRTPHVLVMRTLSKFGLAGVRLGYLAGPAALIDEIEKVRPPYNISVLNAEATLFALEHADEFARQAAVLRAERERLQARAARAARRRAVSERGQHDPGARARREARVRRHEGARRAGQERRRAAPAAGQLPAPDRGHAGGEHADDRRPAARACDERAAATTAAAAPREVQRDTKETQIRVARRPRRQRRGASSPPASASSTTCSTRSPATA